MSDWIGLFFDTEMLRQNMRVYCRWFYLLFPNLLFLGNTGSGKSYGLRVFLARVAIHIKNSKLWICDYKNELLRSEQLPPGCRYYGYNDVIDGFYNFKQIFEERLQGNPNRDFCLLLIDEYLSWLSSMDKKEAEEIKKQMAIMLFSVRSLNMHVVLGAQRGMAENFTYGSRDCLNVLFLGAPSRESVHSFVSGDEAAKMKPCGRGAGYILFDGKPPLAVTVPSIRDMQHVEREIVQAALR